MLEKQNITLSLPKQIIRKAKIIAINHDKSLSGLMADLIITLVKKDEKYDSARQKYLADFGHSRSLGTNGQIDWSRESLHER